MSVLSILVAALCLVSVSGTGTGADTGAKALLKTCIDDSDCRDLDDSAKFACFAYLCYPWKEDSMVPKSEQRTLCRTNSDCDLTQGEQCYRHRDRRNVNKGLCFKNLEECGDTDSTCSGETQCCGTYCCEPAYFDSYAQLPCTSHISCQDLHLGQFCCPRGERNETSVCCDQDPNPPPPTTTSPATVDDPANKLTSDANNNNVAYGKFGFLLLVLSLVFQL